MEQKRIEDMTDEEVAGLDAVEEGKEHPTHIPDMVDEKRLEQERRQAEEDRNRE